MSEPMPTSAPPVPEDSLFTLLREHCPSEVDRAWGLLVPYYALVEQGGPYPLRPADELDQSAIATAIQTAFQLPELPKIVYYSQQRPLSTPDWMIETVYQSSLWDRLWASLGASLQVSLEDRLRDSLWDNQFYYLGFLLSGKIEQAERLSGLIRVQTDCIIAGAKKDEPNTWMVVCQ